MALLRGVMRGVLTQGKRAVAFAIVRRRVKRMRRNPAAVVAALRSARNILIVCHGNIIRSAFAARLVQQAVGDRAQVTVVSAGLAAASGDPAHETAVSTAARLGVDLSGHASAAIAVESVARADVIFVMEVSHLMTLEQRFPEAAARTFLLTCLASDADLEIRDPFGGDEFVFGVCFDQISRAVRAIVGVLPASAGSAAAAVR